MTRVLTQGCNYMSSSLDVLCVTKVSEKNFAEWINQLQLWGCKLEEISTEHIVVDLCVYTCWWERGKLGGDICLHLEIRDSKMKLSRCTFQALGEQHLPFIPFNGRLTSITLIRGPFFHILELCWFVVPLSLLTILWTIDETIFKKLSMEKEKIEVGWEEKG